MWEKNQFQINQYRSNYCRNAFIRRSCELYNDHHTHLDLFNLTFLQFKRMISEWALCLLTFFSFFFFLLSLFPLSFFLFLSFSVYLSVVFIFSFLMLIIKRKKLRRLCWCPYLLCMFIVKYYKKHCLFFLICQNKIKNTKIQANKMLT